jgi:hypothetical protein
MKPVVRISAGTPQLLSITPRPLCTDYRLIETPDVPCRRGQIPGLVISSQGQGLVANLQAGVATVQEPEFKVVNQDQRLYAVIHQYDRNADLTAFYYGKYRFWKEDNEDRTSECNSFRIIEATDLFKVNRDASVPRDTFIDKIRLFGNMKLPCRSGLDLC